METRKGAFALPSPWNHPIDQPSPDWMRAILSKMDHDQGIVLGCAGFCPHLIRAEFRHFIDRNCRLVDSQAWGGITMPDSQKPTRKIIGFSLAPSLAAEVKSEAARRGMSLRKLFEEIWELYKKSKKS
ncbi:MAG: hypothetical protein CL535_19470 [Ahrensia sp.]|nr:hypothetical protein [Ahrensia sp.]